MSVFSPSNFLDSLFIFSINECERVRFYVLLIVIMNTITNSKNINVFSRSIDAFKNKLKQFQKKLNRNTVFGSLIGGRGRF